MLLAQITDTHITEPGALIYDRFDTAAMLRAAINRLNNLRPRPEFVLVTGDLVHHGRPAEYTYFLEIMTALDLPWYPIPGNHDVRPTFLKVFKAHLPADRLAGFAQYSVASGPISILCLDTLHDDHHNGQLCVARLDWLRRQLDASPDKRVILALHHPPFASGIQWIDTGAPMWAKDFEKLVGEHSNIELVICGHVHRASFRRWAGTVAAICPSTCYQVGLDLDDLEAHLNADPPAIHLMRWDGEHIVSHYEPIPQDTSPLELIDRETLVRLKAHADAHAGLIPKKVSNEERKLQS